MKVFLISMPDIAPNFLPKSRGACIPNLGIASVGGNIDAHHDVRIIDLVCVRDAIKNYLTKVLLDNKPELIGLSAMTWQYATCVKIIRLIRTLLPEVQIMIGGYHATLMYEEIAASEEARWIDFIIRGEGEEVCRQLVNTLSEQGDLAKVPSLSYKQDGVFVHNPRSDNLDLRTLKRPIRDSRRLTNGYGFRGVTFHRIEVIETSRGCTRACNFCSMRHMYGRQFRAFPIERVLEDIDDIYFRRKTRWIIFTDDNIVLDQERLMRLCDAMIAKKYKGLKCFVQTDCRVMAKNEKMVAKMVEAGFKCMLLGIENASRKNLSIANKGDIIAVSKKAVENCHKYGATVLGLFITGFPDDDEVSIRENYEFAKSIQCDLTLFQILNPYPKTGIRDQLLEQDLVINKTDYTKYNGAWANVRTKYLDTEQLQYQVWLQKRIVLMEDWKPSPYLKKFDWPWISLSDMFIQPFWNYYRKRILSKYGLDGLYKKTIEDWERLNRFEDIDE